MKGKRFITLAILPFVFIGAMGQKVTPADGTPSADRQKNVDGAGVNANVAYKDNSVRFTMVTDGVVRMEWSPDGRFVDNASFVASRRDYVPSKFKVSAKGKTVEISTAKMIVRYRKGSGRFTAENLSIRSAKGMKPFTWKPGDADNANLKGTYRTLDGYNGSTRWDGKEMPLEDGLLSRNGWKFIDDSQSYLFDKSDWPWVEERPEKDCQDWYFMAYGHDYKSALGDYTTFAGKVPLPPRYAFGYWWSRYWSYSDNELHNLLDHFHRFDIPLDVLVIDMDWHYTDQGRGGWTGYTWNRGLFPNSTKLLNDLRDQGLKLTLNLHPADGIHNYDTHFSDLAKAMGVDAKTTSCIPFEASNKRFMSGWFDTILKPMEKEGISFWWLDWQQWLNDKKFQNLSNTWWINYAFFSNFERTRTTRPMLYHRWGGLGNHRYQIGFSGDSYISWKSLDFQPYFNATASNVLYGYWSHDIGGHMLAEDKPLDPELYVRWMQFGALSPILRTHSTKNALINKEPWAFNYQYTDMLIDIINQRYAMAPYIYTMARKTFDSGVSLCRPMYYDYPEAEQAYNLKDEYMFGDNMLVAPITASMTEGLSRQKVWLPAGDDWYEWQTGTLLRGGQEVERTFKLDEYPIYMKAGSILPFYGKVKNLQGCDEPVVVTVFPGSKGSFCMYEDNGDDKDYATYYATTNLSQERTGSRLTVKIEARKGDYPGMPLRRHFSVKVLASAVPESVTVNGTKADFSYDGRQLALTVDLAETDCSMPKTVVITYPADAPDLTDGLLAKMRHAEQTAYKYKQRNAGIVWTDSLADMESAGRAITYYPNELTQRVATFRKSFSPPAFTAQGLEV
jgi:alpha-glucosidase (family GH31 glycosyl hydrolase)